MRELRGELRGGRSLGLQRLLEGLEVGHPLGGKVVGRDVGLVEGEHENFFRAAELLFEDIGDLADLLPPGQWIEAIKAPPALVDNTVCIVF